MPSPATQTAAPEPLLLSRQVAAKMLSISVRALDYLVAGKQITTRRIGSRVLIPATEVRRMAREDHPFGVSSPAQLSQVDQTRMVSCTAWLYS